MANAPATGTNGMNVTPLYCL